MMKVDPGLVLVTYVVRFSLDIRFVYTVSNTMYIVNGKIFQMKFV
jgi:hypothetical protein